jgi:glutaredoxin
MLVFSSTNCYACIKLKQYLNDNKINYKEYLIEEDNNQNIFIDNKIKSLPTIIYNNKRIIGFNKRELEELVK